MTPRRVVVAGGSGLIGTHLTRVWRARGDEVVVLSRKPRTEGEVGWTLDPQHTWSQTLEATDAVVNLSGSTVAKAHTPAYREVLDSSRVRPTTVLGQAISLCEFPPKVWINVSAVGIYGDRGGEVLPECSPAGSTFLAGLCDRWEGACLRADTPTTRKVVPRLGVVLAREGGAFREFRKLPFGGIGPGSQYLPWVHVTDLVRAFDWAIDGDFTGCFNLVAPAPLTSREFFAALAHATHRLLLPPLPEAVFRVIATLTGLEPSVALESQRVEPRTLTSHGFQFTFPDVQTAILDLLSPIT